MAHTVRPESSRNDTHTVRPAAVRQDVGEADRADELTIDLRQGDLSDEVVVSMLLQLARERAAEADDTNVLGVAASGPAHQTTYHDDEPRRRWWPAAGAIAVALVVATLVVVGMRPRHDPAAQAAAAVADEPAPSTSTPPSTRAVVGTDDRGSTRTTPSSVAPRPTAPSTEAERTAEFCTAVRTYTLDDLPTLAQNGVRDPRGTIEAYAAMVANAPAGIADDVTALGPITGKVQSEIETGVITTPEQMQQYLAGGAPSDEVARWIAAQQAIVAELPRLCPDHIAPSPGG